ncbi:MAG: hypothetical protein WAV45_03525 [Propionibacteriaceae bacterium]
MSLDVASARSSRWAPWVTASGFTAGVFGASFLTVWRYTADYLQADGVMQALMSVQHVDLFFWGQDRFFSFVPLLMSFIADPDLNLAACLVTNAVGFHLLLLTLSYLGAGVVTGSRRPLPVATLFATAILVANLVIRPDYLHVMALETQPYSWSYCLALWAFLLWRRGGGWRWVLAVVLVGPAVGLNPSGVLVIGALALASAIRHRRWLTWILFGAFWVVWEGIWVLLSRTFGEKASPTDTGGGGAYFRFSLTDLLQYGRKALVHQGSAIHPLALGAVGIVGALLLIAVPRDRCKVLAGVGLGVGAFCAAFWALFAANEWVRTYGFHPRYFYPVFMAVIMALATPTAALAAAPQRLLARLGRPSTPALVFRIQSGLIVVALLAYAVLVGRGPLRAPSESQVFLATAATADFATKEGITFVAGSYWPAVPITLRLLREGRSAAHYVGLKTGGDPADYPAALARELAKPGVTPRAVCVNTEATECIEFLNAWTAAGWTVSGETCPPPQANATMGSQKPTCLILRFPRSGG